MWEVVCVCRKRPKHQVKIVDKLSWHLIIIGYLWQSKIHPLKLVFKAWYCLLVLFSDLVTWFQYSSLWQRTNTEASNLLKVVTWPPSIHLIANFNVFLPNPTDAAPQLFLENWTFYPFHYNLVHMAGEKSLRTRLISIARNEGAWLVNSPST